MEVDVASVSSCDDASYIYLPRFVYASRLTPHVSRLAVTLRHDSCSTTSRTSMLVLPDSLYKSHSQSTQLLGGARLFYLGITAFGI